MMLEPDTDDRLPLRSRFREWRYRHVHRPARRLFLAAIHRLPRAVKEAAYIDVGVEAVSRMPASTVVPEVGMLEALQAYGGRRA